VAWVARFFTAAFRAGRFFLTEVLVAPRLVAFSGRVLLARFFVALLLGGFVTIGSPGTGTLSESR
jgi:hypothetical protein